MFVDDTNKMNKIIKFLIIGLVVYGISMLFSGISVNGYISALFVVILLSLVNTFVKPVLQLLTLPITVVTFGLFLLVINGGMILLVDWFLAGFEVANFWWALLMSICLSFVNSIIDGKTKAQPQPKLGETKYYRIDEPINENTGRYL